MGKDLSHSLFPAFHPSMPFFACTVNQPGNQIPFLNNETATTFNEGASIFFTSIDEAFQNRLPVQESHPDVIEAFPSWSKNGKYLFSSIAVGGNHSPNFNLIRRQFLASTLTTSPADTLVNTTQLKKSAITPQLSPDGKYLLFCLSDDGNRPLWHKSSDLYVMDMSSGAWNQLSIANSTDVDNQPVWSSNGRWIIFGSNRLDGTYTRLYIAYFDTDGMIHTPFILPQRNPSYDGNTFKSCNTPAFLSEPNTTSQLRMMAYMLAIFDKR